MGHRVDKVPWLGVAGTARRSTVSLDTVDARQIYAALFDCRGPVGEPRGDWPSVRILRTAFGNRLFL
jgi:hypothetical protein